MKQLPLCCCVVVTVLHKAELRAHVGAPVKCLLLSGSGPIYQMVNLFSLSCVLHRKFQEVVTDFPLERLLSDFRCNMHKQFGLQMERELSP